MNSCNNPRDRNISTTDTIIGCSLGQHGRFYLVIVSLYPSSSGARDNNTVEEHLFVRNSQDYD